MNKKPLVVLTGPTAAGKTELSVKLAQMINGEIISADSMQIYKYMNIGTAKVTTEEMDGVPHFLVDELEPDEEFNVVKFKEMAKRAMEEIYSRDRIPIIVGGTGFYIQAVLKDIDFEIHQETGNNYADYRNELEEFAISHGPEALHNKLKEVDEVSAEEIHANNVRRVIRALEYYYQTGTPISGHNAEQKQKGSPYNFAYFVLNNDRTVIYERINNRVDKMIENGLVEEVKGLMENGYQKDLVSMQGLGYKEIIDYLEDQCTLDEAVYILKRDTRHFAKRQITWFKREKDVIWFNAPDYENDSDRILSAMVNVLREKNILDW